MRKLFTSRLFRCVVCLILVCALLVSWSPIRAKAVGTDQYVAVVIDKVGFYAQAGAVSTGAAVFGYVIAGLGLIVSTAKTIEIMNDYMEWSGELDSSIYYYPDGTWSYGVDVGFVDRVRAFLFDRGYVVDTGNLTTVVPEGETFINYTANGPCVAFMYSYSYYSSSRKEYVFINDGYLVSTVPNYKITVNGKTADGSITYNNNKHYYYCFSHGIKYYNETELAEVLAEPSDYYYVGDTGTTYSLSSVIKKYGWSGVVGAGDTSIDYVASPDVSIDVAYPDWYSNARPAVQPDTDEEITVLPIPLNPSADPETQIGTMTQPDIWQGSIADPMPDTGTDTDDPDSGSNDPTTPTTGTDNPDSPGDDGSQDVPLTPDQLQPFVVDLRDFFPFCIPFDLYDFFQLLDADPVAPVFHWEIQDLAGNVYSIDIDLSAWDSTALFFRRLQLLVFTVGLAMASRKFIKW